MNAISFKTLKQATLLSVPLLAILLTIAATPAFAHHPMGGKLPITWLDGFLSGIAHPLIGVDHFAFIVAIGLMAATRQLGVLLPIAFTLGSMAGAGTHLGGWNVPGIEFLVSGSLVVFGSLIALRHNLNKATLAGLGAIAGLFHGYAYAEAIFGAEATPLLSYLVGFSVIQLVVSLGIFAIGKAFIAKSNAQSQNLSQLDSAGWIIFGIGLAFFASQLIDLVLPASVA